MLGTSFLALALALVPSSVRAVSLNGDTTWNLACTGGHCAHSSGGIQRAHTTFTISGPSGALSDLTSAAGWQIQGCPADWSSGAVTVTIKCSGSRAQMALCNQLFEDGSEDTIVRLPANCGTGPFARVVSSTEIKKAANVISSAQSHTVVLDYNFNAIKKVRGRVSFAVATSNAPSTATVPADASVLRRETPDLLKRWSVNELFDLPPLAFNKAWNLFSQSISCPAPQGTGVGFSAGVSVDASVNVNALAALGFNVEGSIIPPGVDKFQIIGTLNGSASADFTVQAQAQGSFDIGKLTLYETSLAGLDIPGILSVGPKFGVYGTLRADIGLEATIKTGVSYTYPTTTWTWPQSSGSAANTLRKQSPLVISVDPKATATGAVTASVEPRLEVGISVLAGWADASVYLDANAGAALNLNVEGHASVGSPPGASGCASLDASFAITAGAKGTLSPFFDKEVTYPIYSTQANAFNKCFTAGSAATKAKRVEARSANEFTRRAFVCPALGLADLVQLVKA